MALLEVEGLGISFPRAGGGRLPIVSDVSFRLEKGETMGLVGESGSGKSLVALAIMGLLPDAAAASGAIRLDGDNLLEADEEALCLVRGGRFGMIFQEPMAALNPAMRVGTQVAEGMVRHRGLGWAAARQEAVRLLDRVRMTDAAHRAEAYPHELSGGQRQRVGIALALALEPDLLIADEPTTALDVTVQADILDLLDELVRDSGMALILVSHDLGVIARAAGKMLVLYAGTRMEEGPTASVLHAPLNPYTGGLLAAIPKKRATPLARLTTIQGQTPRYDALPGGCRFAPRCKERLPVCNVTEPGWTRVAAERGVRCHLHGGGDG